MRGNPWTCFCLCALVLLTSCGYPADPLPPALNRPNRVTDLSAVQRGGRIVITYTKPAKTTEDLPIKSSEDELRIGTIPDSGFNLQEWEQSSDAITTRETPSAKYENKNVAIAVKIKGPKGQSAGWSNFVTLSVIPALTTPEALQAINAADAVRLEWHATAPNYRIFRKLSTEKEFTPQATSSVTVFTDNTIEYGKAYVYYVQAFDGRAESEPSKPAEIAPEDKFPPATPAGITVAPGARTIELLWDRNAEKDFASYTVYRDGAKIAGPLTSPAYSDRDVKPGTRYSYQLTATDTRGNESPRSAAIEALIP